MKANILNMAASGTQLLSAEALLSFSLNLLFARAIQSEGQQNGNEP